MILTIKTDQPTAELALYKDEVKLDEIIWHAHRELSTTLLSKIHDILEQNQLSFDDLSGVAVFKGPGSFTGLRIGAVVANTLSYSLNAPVVGTSGDNWQLNAISRIKTGENDQIVQPEYGGKPNITKPKK